MAKPDPQFAAVGAEDTPTAAHSEAAVSLLASVAGFEISSDTCTTAVQTTLAASGTNSGEDSAVEEAHGSLSTDKETVRTGHAAQRRTADAANRDSGPATPEAPEALKLTLDGIAPVQPRPNEELPPYIPALSLSTECYQLHDVATTDLASNYSERLKRAVWIYTGQHVVGVCVRLGPEGSCQVLLDLVKVLDAGSVGTGSSMGGNMALLGTRRLDVAAGGRLRRQGDVMPDAEFGISHLRAALLHLPWWQRGWLPWWARPRASAAAAALLRLWDGLWTDSAYQTNGSVSSSGMRVASTHAISNGGPTAATTAMTDCGSHGRVLSRRITAVVPRVVLLDPAAGGWARGADALQTDPSETRAWTPCLQVTASVCCSSPPDAAGASGTRACEAGNEAGSKGTCNQGSQGISAEATNGEGPTLKILLRYSQSFAVTCSFPLEQPEQGVAAGAARTCRRSICRRHLTLRHDVKLAECTNESMAASLVEPTTSGLGPGLLLLDLMSSPTQPTSVQRPVPVLLLDDPAAAEELRLVLTDRQTSSGSAANFDSLLVDLGVFAQHLGAWRCATAPVLVLADAGLLRHGRIPPCCCQHGATIEKDRPPRCGACEVARLREFSEQTFSVTPVLTLGELLLRYATSVGWIHTAAYISSCLIELQRIDVLVGTVLGISACGDAGFASVLRDADFASMLRDCGCYRASGPFGPLLALWRCSKATLRAACRRNFQLPGSCAVAASRGPPLPSGAWFGVQGTLAQMRQLGVAGVIAFSMVAYGLHLLIAALIQALVNLAARFDVMPPSWLGGVPRMALTAILATVSAQVVLTHTRACSYASSSRSGAAPLRVRTGGWRVRL